MYKSFLAFVPVFFSIILETWQHNCQKNDPYTLRQGHKGNNS